MESSEAIENSIDNKVEGPQQKYKIYINKNEYINLPPSSRENWVYDQILNNLSEGQIKNAIAAVVDERKVRLEAGKGFMDPVLTEEAKKYAFRGVRRRSDGEPNDEHNNATIDTVDPNLHLYGVENPNPDSAKYIKPGIIYDRYALPTPPDIKEGLDVGIIFVYENKPFVLPSEKKGNKITLYEPGNIHPKETDIETAQKQKYPTLRDIYLGQIEIHFDDVTS